MSRTAHFGTVRGEMGRRIGEKIRYQTDGRSHFVD